MNVGLDQFRTPVRHFGPEDRAILDQACETGRLPDGRIATQERLALYLNFSRQTIVNNLAGRKLPLHVELKREGGSRGGISAKYRRQLSRINEIKRHENRLCGYCKTRRIFFGGFCGTCVRRWKVVNIKERFSGQFIPAAEWCAARCMSKSWLRKLAKRGTIKMARIDNLPFIHVSDSREFDESALGRNRIRRLGLTNLTSRLPD